MFPFPFRRAAALCLAAALLFAIFPAPAAQADTLPECGCTALCEASVPNPNCGRCQAAPDQCGYQAKATPKAAPQPAAVAPTETPTETPQPVPPTEVTPPAPKAEDCICEAAPCGEAVNSSCPWCSQADFTPASCPHFPEETTPAQTPPADTPPAAPTANDCKCSQPCAEGSIHTECPWCSLENTVCGYKEDEIPQSPAKSEAVLALEAQVAGLETYYQHAGDSEEAYLAYIDATKAAYAAYQALTEEEKASTDCYGNYETYGTLAFYYALVPQDLGGADHDPSKCVTGSDAVWTPYSASNSSTHTYLTSDTAINAPNHGQTICLNGWNLTLNGPYLFPSQAESIICNCSGEGSVTLSGGTITITGGAFTFIGTTINGNFASTGGSSATLTFQNCTINDSIALKGEASKIILTNSTVMGDVSVAPDPGEDSYLTLADSTIKGTVSLSAEQTGTPTMMTVSGNTVLEKSLDATQNIRIVNNGLLGSASISVYASDKDNIHTRIQDPSPQIYPAPGSGLVINSETGEITVLPVEYTIHIPDEIIDTDDSETKHYVKVTSSDESQPYTGGLKVSLSGSYSMMADGMDRDLVGFGLGNNDVDRNTISYTVTLGGERMTHNQEQSFADYSAPLELVIDVDKTQGQCAGKYTGRLKFTISFTE